MVSIKEAAENAMAFAQEALGPNRTTGLRLEEVESGAICSEEVWLITLSLIRSDIDDALAALAVNFRKQREYKSFTVRKSDGEVISMRIRELADA